ncbi:hypothetical protein MJO29_006174 [Puccinia striiformis f. sp. tritici]|nr:hypothetical protein MJO29_006174 [Puccinia striiformis f. sp. tritici]
MNDLVAKRIALPPHDLNRPTVVQLAFDNGAPSPIILRHGVTTSLSDPHSALDFDNVTLKLSPITGKYDVILGTPFLTQFNLSPSLATRSLCDCTLLWIAGDTDWLARGPARLRFDDGNVLELSDALYVPNLTRNLVSLVQLMQHKVTITGSNYNYTVQIDDGQSFPVDTSNYILEIDGISQPVVTAQAHTITASPAVHLSEFQRWHNRLGHASRARIQVALKNPLPPSATVTCDACMSGKLTKLPFNSHFRPVTAPLEVVHGDLVGPISPATNGGARYFLTLVDQYSGHIHTSILKLKSDALEAINAYKVYFERQTGYTIKKLVTDGGGEFVNKALSAILAEEGILHTVSPPYTPQHNGFAERANRTIIDMTRTMMMQANMAPEWWAEAVKTATATTNCLPSLLAMSRSLRMRSLGSSSMVVELRRVSMSTGLFLVIRAMIPQLRMWPGRSSPIAENLAKTFSMSVMY